GLNNSFNRRPININMRLMPYPIYWHTFLEQLFHQFIQDIALDGGIGTVIVDIELNIGSSHFSCYAERHLDVLGPGNLIPRTVSHAVGPTWINYLIDHIP